jgi:hypothetical protein
MAKKKARIGKAYAGIDFSLPRTCSHTDTSVLGVKYILKALPLPVLSRWPNSAHIGLGLWSSARRLRLFFLPHAATAPCVGFSG